MNDSYRRAVNLAGSLAAGIAVGGARQRTYMLIAEAEDSLEAVSALLPFSFGMFLLCALFMCAWICLEGERTIPCAGLISGVIALLMTAFQALYDGGSVAAMTSGIVGVLYTIVSLVGWFFAANILFLMLGRLCRWVSGHAVWFESVYDRLAGDKPLLRTAGLLFAAWLPFALVRFPAGIEYDGYHQLLEFFGYQQMTTHWAPASSAVMGFPVWLGRTVFGSEKIGVFAFVLLQMAVTAAVIAFATETAAELGASKSARLSAVAVCAVIPVFPGFATSVVKDTLFAGVVLLFVTLLIRYLYLDRRGIRDLAAMFAVSLLMAVLRSNGIYIILPQLLMAVCAAVRMRGRYHVGLVIALLLSVVCYRGYSGLFLPAVGVKPYPTQTGEALSVPFQQTAALVSIDEKNLSEDEKRAIDAVIDYDELKEVYDPGLSDPVKATYHAKDGDLGRYFKVWAACGLRNPVIYADAFLQLNGGFLYPELKQENQVNAGMYRTWWPGEGELDFSPPKALIPLRSAAMAWAVLLENFPLTYPFGAPALNIWLAASLFIIAVRRLDKRMVFAVMPSMTGAAVCLASPTYLHNGARYALPIIFCNIILVLLAAVPLKNKEI